MGNSTGSDLELFPDMESSSSIRFPDKQFTQDFPRKQSTTTGFEANDHSSTHRQRHRQRSRTLSKGKSKAMSVKADERWPNSNERLEVEERLSSSRILRPVVKSLGFDKTYGDESYSLDTRPSEEVSTMPSQAARRSVSYKAKRRRKSSLGRGRSSRRSRVGPTAPKPGPIAPTIIKLTRSKSKKKGKKKRVGPTQPGPTRPPSDNESSETGEYDSERHQEKKYMPNWKQPWENIHQIKGLQVDDKSETTSPRRDFNFFKDCGVEINICELNKERSPIPVRRRLYFRDDLHVEEDDREQADISLGLSPKQKPRHSVRSLVSVVSSVQTEISDLSHAPTINTRSEVSSLSDYKDQESPSLILQASYMNEYMPNKSWASPHAKDYEDDPYHMRQFKFSHKGPMRVQ